MTYRIQIQCRGPRPSLNALSEMLWGPGADTDSDGDSVSGDDGQWTELTLENRSLPGSRIDVDPVSAEPLVLELRGEDGELLERVAKFMVDTSNGRIVGRSREELQDVPDPLAQLAELPGIDGCSEPEIDSLERELGFTFPTVYRRFLRLVGRESGEFMDGSVFHGPQLVRLQAAARELLSETSAAWTLEPSDFVFLMHEGYEFLFFRADDSDDPPVYFYLEHDPAPRRFAPSFSEWLSAAVEELGSSDDGA